MDKTLLKLEQILKDNQKEIDKEKSSYWKKGVRDHNFYDYTTSLRSGSFTPRTFKQLIYNYLNQRLYFNNINGFNVFTSEVYKKTLQIAKKQNRVLDYDFLRMVFTYNFLIEQKMRYKVPLKTHQ